jgi:hypothetical protein
MENINSYKMKGKLYLYKGVIYRIICEVVMKQDGKWVSGYMYTQEKDSAGYYVRSQDEFNNKFEKIPA